MDDVEFIQALDRYLKRINDSVKIACEFNEHITVLTNNGDIYMYHQTDAKFNLLPLPTQGNKQRVLTADVCLLG